MKTVTFPKNTPFDEATGELRPDYRHAYLLGQLSPVVGHQVEAYLQRNPIQKHVLLASYRELSAQATQSGRTLVPPRWVQQQLLRQATHSPAGPLRRPLVRVVLGTVLVLLVASTVQWLRNEPLVPAPVVAAVGRAAASARVVTRQWAQRLALPAAPATVAHGVAPRRRPAGPPRPKPASQPLAAAGRPAALAPLAADSVRILAGAPGPATPARTLPALPATDSLLAPPARARPVLVHGRISDASGHPLPGATVMVPGTQLVTSANASGEYELSVPAGAQLAYAYGGYVSHSMTASGDALDVTLAPEAKRTKRQKHAKRRH